MNIEILTVDKAYTPDRWINVQEALNLISRGIVQSSFGETAITLRGGTNAITGRQSVLEVGSILVVDTRQWTVKDFNYAPFDNHLVFKRDKWTCAYCGCLFKGKDLTMDHVRPMCQGGETSWSNIVTACGVCNQRKAGRTPAQAKMDLLYVPYRPNRFEWLILKGRNVLGDQMDFLMSKVPKHSRLHQ